VEPINLSSGSAEPTSAIADEAERAKLRDAAAAIDAAATPTPASTSPTPRA